MPSINIKINFFLTVLVVYFFTSCTTPKYISLSEEDKGKFKLNKYSSTVEIYIENRKSIYLIDSAELQYLLSVKNNYHLLVFFTDWCPNSKELLPVILKESSNKGINIMLITPDDWIYQDRYLAYLNKSGHNDFPLFMLDAYYYTQKNIHKKMDTFIKSFCTNCEDVGGFPSVILLNRDKKPVFKGLINKKNIKNYSTAIQNISS